MSKKRLDENAIINELKGGSLFFQKTEQSPAVSNSQKDFAQAPVMPLESPQGAQVDGSSSQAKVEVVHQESMKKPNELDSSHASTLASYPNSMINTIRKVVKSVGKEVSFVRLTIEEKNQLVDIVYTYKRQGVKTSENEINRIAVNFLLEDYKANGESSILAKVIAALLA